VIDPMRRVSVCSPPDDAFISREFNGADFVDCYAIDIAHDRRTALQLYLDIAAKTPRWVNVLMSARNRIARMVGLKNLGTLNEVEPSRAYRVGDRVGIFRLHHATDNEVVLGDADRHLEVKISAAKFGTGSAMQLKVTTVVHVRNRLGHAYMFFVAPAHRRIVPAVLLRGVSPP
jgi:Protein of unknown function (DUF2867)